MKLVLLSLLLLGCGSYQVGYKEEKLDETKDGKKGSEEDGDTDESGGSSEFDKDGNPIEDEDATIALVYEYIELSDVARITSSTKIINTLYFTGTDQAGHRVLGRVKPGSSKAELIPFGRLSANNITLSDQDYYLASNLDDYIYLIDDDVIVQVDLTTLEAVGKVASPCAFKAPITFIKDKRWNSVWYSKVVTCGMADGAKLSSETVVDGYTAQPLELDNFSSFSFDSENIWRFSPRQKQLVKYSPTWAQVEVYSTSAFLYSSDRATFVSDSNGSMWFFGCNETKGACYVATAELAEQ
jgi:hypothetical protein